MLYKIITTPTTIKLKSKKPTKYVYFPKKPDTGGTEPKENKNVANTIARPGFNLNKFIKDETLSNIYKVWYERKETKTKKIPNIIKEYNI